MIVWLHVLGALVLIWGFGVGLGRDDIHSLYYFRFLVCTYYEVAGYVLRKEDQACMFVCDEYSRSYQ